MGSLVEQQIRLKRIAIIAALLLYPFLDRALGFQTLNAVTDAAVYVVLALGLNIVVGYAGLLDLGYAAFFAIGAYTVGIFTWPGHGLEWNFWIVIWISVAVCAFFGVIIGSPTLRLRGDYLAIVTLGFEFGFDPLPWYYMILAIACLTVYVSRQLERSRLGRAWMAIREDETAADCMGINPVSTKLLGFALGASFSGFAGSVCAAKLQAI